MANFNTPGLSSRSPHPMPSGLVRADWRCLECGKLLGVRHGARLHIRLRCHDYLVSLPVESVCPGCGAENRT